MLEISKGVDLKCPQHKHTDKIVTIGNEGCIN